MKDRGVAAAQETGAGTAAFRWRSGSRGGVIGGLGEMGRLFCRFFDGHGYRVAVCRPEKWAFRPAGGGRLRHGTFCGASAPDGSDHSRKRPLYPSRSTSHGLHQSEDRADQGVAPLPGLRRGAPSDVRRPYFHIFRANARSLPGSHRFERLGRPCATSLRSAVFASRKPLLKTTTE